MIISGIQKCTLLDFPGKIACVVFTGGCNFRCGYCHNPEFVLPERLARLSHSFIPEAALLNFLRRRQGLLEGVVITGGEPTLMPDLASCIRRIRALGFSVKLDSNGNRPAVLRSLIEQGLVDYVALDVKASLAGYAGLVGRAADPVALQESITLLKANSVEYEFRVTLIREIHTPTMLAEMRTLLAGAKRVYLQMFRSGLTLNPVFADYHPFSLDEAQLIAEQFRDSCGEVSIRS